MAMSSSTTMNWLAALVVIAMMAVQSESAVTCPQVVSKLRPCVVYVANQGPLQAECCTGIRALYSLAQTTPDRRNVCNCIKNAISGFSFSSTNLNLAAGLPAKCGVNLPYKISPSTDCNNIV
ncbi:non-specific lipid-transfer protein 3-like [Carica papaya]|uniref:non-specific lipid-transfer protein 3-like n=1 Tax=Carica papaya TaxID=3649 RepID=UPI000B8C879C|nr:non-specific lipid-transfer protein 3-like [Carica papaya]